MKRAFVGSDDDGAKAKFLYQTRLTEYLELQKECVSRKRKLQAAKVKRAKILAQVRFLRQKRKYLLETKAPNIEKVSLYLPNSDIETNRGRKQSSSHFAPKNFEQVIVSNPHLETGDDQEEGYIQHKDVKFKAKIKKPLIRNKGVGKRKICVPDQVTLKV